MRWNQIPSGSYYTYSSKAHLIVFSIIGYHDVQKMNHKGSAIGFKHDDKNWIFIDKDHNIIEAHGPLKGNFCYKPHKNFSDGI